MRFRPTHRGRRRPGPLSARVAQWRSEMGDSLVEILLAITIISIAAVSILLAFATSIAGTGEHRNLATFDTVLRTASAEVSSDIQQQSASSFANCSGAYQVNAAAPGSIPLPTSYSAQITSVAYWNGSAFMTPQAPAQSCPTGALPNSPQELTITVSYKGSSSSITTVVDDPITPPSSGTTCQYAASQLVWLQQPSSGLAGAALFPVPTVAVEDKTGCIIQSDASQVSLAITAGTGTAGATLNNCTASLNYGTTIFSGCSIGVIGTGYTLTASDPTDGLAAVQSSPFNIAAGVPAVLVFKQQPGGGTGGTPWSAGNQPTVWIEDAQGNLVTTDQSPVTLSIGTNPANGTLSGCSSTNAVNGVATFAGCTIDKAGTGYTLTAADPTDSLNIPVASNAFTIAVGPPSQLAFATSPAGAVVGDPFGTQPAVAVEDAGGNVVTTDTSSVSLAIGTNPGNGTLSGCSGTTTLGVTTFSGCAINQVGTGYTLVATDGSLTSATSSPFNVATPQLASFAVTNPGTQTAGTPFAVGIVALDQAGGTYTGLNGPQTLTFGGNATSNSPNGSAPTLPSSVTFVNGVTNPLPSFTLTDAQSNATLTVKLGSVTGSTSFTVVAGARASLSLTGITQQPTPSVSCTGPSGSLITCTSTGEGNPGSASARTLTASIELVDAYDNAVTNSTGNSITISLSVSGTSGSSLNPTSLTVANHSSTTSGTFTFVRASGSSSSNVMTAKYGGTTELTVTLSA